MRLLATALIALLVTTGTRAATPAATPNALAGDPSPYLAMHGHDPVSWRAWGTPAVAHARDGGRLLFVSVGYFSCYWCHVMHRESYADPVVGEYLNTHFVPVKVDRELAPALDAYLIDFVSRTRGRAGWPLNVFLTPEGYPLAGFTYMPRDEFLKVLKRVRQRWSADAERLSEAARKAAKVLADSAPGAQAGPLPADARDALQQLLVAQAMKLADELAGGFGASNKFPSVPQLRALMAVQAMDPSSELDEFLELTLEQMRDGGLRDQLSGGFFRYTVDPGWRIPHFEKMLYDNAQLASLYLDAGVQFGRADFTETGRDTLAFMVRELSAPGGGYISSLSAVDDAGEEGGYYLWDDTTLTRVLPEDARAVARLAWHLEGAPELEGGHHPVRGAGTGEIAERLGITEARTGALRSQARAALLRERAGRQLPRDEKVIAAWNGLVLSALARGAGLAGGDTFQAAGSQLRDYLAGTLWDGQALRRSVHGGRGVGEAALEDYAYTARALADWYTVSGDPDDLALARTLVRQGWQRFHGERGWRLSEAPVIPHGPGEPFVADGAMPAPSAVMVETTLRLFPPAEDDAIGRRARETLTLGGPALQDTPFYYASHIVLLRTSPPAEAENTP